MKKSIILLVASGALLASCGSGKSITRDEAKTLVDNMVTHVEADGFALPSKGTGTGVMKSNGYESNIEMAFDKDAKYLRSFQVTTRDGKTTSDYAWAFQDGEKYYMASATSEDGKDGHKTEVTAEVIDKMIAQYVDGAFDPAAMLKQISKEIDAMAEMASLPLPAGAAITKNELKESYNSSGDGNLVVEFAADIAYSVTIGDIVNASEQKGTVKYEIKDYLVTNVEQSSYVKMSMGEEVQETTASTTNTYEWGKCELSKPDLSKFAD